MRWESFRQQNQQVGLGKRWGHTCNSIKGGRFLYVFGGFGNDDSLTNQIHVFDSETEIWTQPVINGLPPCPRDSHTCTTVGDNLFVFGGTNGTNHLNDLHILDTSSHTWKCPDVRGDGPEAREAHSATLVDKCIFVFGGCGKSRDSDDEVFYNDLYILNTETFVWKRAATSGNPPSARDSHTCSTWKNKIVVIGGEDLDDYYLSDVHILDTDTLVWKELKTSGQLLTPRAGHVTVALDRNLYVFGGFTDSQNLYDDLYMLDVETGVWSRVVAMEAGPSARFSTAAVCLGPYKAGLFLFVGGCNKNLEALDDIYYLHTEGGYSAGFDQNPGRLSMRKQMKLKCQWQNFDVANTNNGRGRQNHPLSIGLMDQGKPIFQARVTENVPLGYTIETIIDGKVLRGVLFSNRHSSVRTVDPSFSSKKRPTKLDTTDCCDQQEAKTPRTLSKDSAGGGSSSSLQGDTPMIGSVDAIASVKGTQDAEVAVVASDVKDPTQVDMDIVNAEASLVSGDQVNVETVRNEISTDNGGDGDATKAGLGGDASSPQNQGDS
ncbi:unnamed protein product [Cochlearia groenlandica]